MRNTMQADRRHAPKIKRGASVAVNRQAGNRIACADHTHCTAQALRRAERLCADRAVKLTPLRRQVLQLVWRSHRPAGAYELLSALRRLHPGAEPPTVYRALAFLREHGMVHRLASLKAFIGCPAPHQGRMAHFLICSRCGEVREMQDPEIAKAVTSRAANVEFQLADQVVELHGLCAQCR